MQYRRRQSRRSCAGGRGELVLESSAEGDGLREGEALVGGRRLPVLEAVFFIVVPAGVDPSRSLLSPFTPPPAAAAAPTPLFFCFLLAGPSSRSSGSASSKALPPPALAVPLAVAVPAGALRSTDKSRTGSCVEERYPQTRHRTSDWSTPEKVRCIMQSQRREAKPSSDDASCP